MNERPDKPAGDALPEKARALFDESVSGLDGETLSRLNRGRQAAIAELGSGRPRLKQWLPATGFAAAAVIAVVLVTRGPAIDDVTAPEIASDMEILLTEDSLEMLEDLEFYSWMELAEPEEIAGPENNVG
jgi:hypothetical protein